MKKAYLAIVAITLVTVVVGCTKGYESQKTTGNLQVTLTASRYPLVKGDNSLNVKVSDTGGKAVTDAKVEARYYMPAMLGMAPTHLREAPMHLVRTFLWKAAGKLMYQLRNRGKTHRL